MRTDYVLVYSRAAEVFREATQVYLNELDLERKRAEKAMHFASLIAAPDAPLVRSGSDETDALKLAMERAEAALQMEAAE